MQKEPLIIVAVINWNGVAITYNEVPILAITLNSLLKTEYNNKRIMVVDSSSSDNSINFIKHKFSGVDVISVEDKGLGYSVNKAVEYIYKEYPDFEYIVILNNDLIFKDRLWLKKLLSPTKLDATIGLIGCRLKYPSGKIQHGGGRVSIIGPKHVINPRIAKQSRYVDWVTGATMLIKRETINSIGLFDETYLPFYSEDTDYCFRAKRAGCKIYYVGNTSIVHLEGYSFSKSPVKKKWNSESLYFSIHRNSYIFIFRYMPLLLPTALIYDIAANLFARKPKFHTKNLLVGLHMSYLLLLALANAKNSYKKSKIKKIK